MPTESTVSLLPARDVCARVGVSRGHLYRLMKRRTHPFPAPIHVGRAARWPSTEVAAWIEGEIDRDRRRSRQADR